MNHALRQGRGGSPNPLPGPNLVDMLPSSHLIGFPEARCVMPESTSAYTADELYRVDLEAFLTSLFVYKTAGAKIRASRRREFELPIPIFGDMFRGEWQAWPVDSLAIRVSYEGMFVTGVAGNGIRGASVVNNYECEDRLWAVGFSLSFEASGAGGGPGGVPTPGGNAKLDVRGVRAHGTAIIGGHAIELPVASVGFNSEVPF